MAHQVGLAEELASVNQVADAHVEVAGVTTPVGDAREGEGGYEILWGGKGQ